MIIHSNAATAIVAVNRTWDVLTTTLADMGEIDVVETIIDVDGSPVYLIAGRVSESSLTSAATFRDVVYHLCPLQRCEFIRQAIADGFITSTATRLVFNDGSTLPYASTLEV